ncbi:MAG: T9SS type A sorting domain-containing protein [Candidatus Marinimicrobia bacterium]|nr:T9SS type A sorting domain-containing protein [Candidatus Neomarinimicrobiota bacterium]
MQFLKQEDAIRKLQLITLFLTALLSLGATERTKVLAHYMPWYQNVSVSGYWGWHWTMNYFTPQTIDPEGRRSIASHYYPLTGPYDSRDIDLLEYHVLLMKLAGIDGVIVDWYGIEDYHDYAALHEATEELFYSIQEAELEFSICYEDRTVEAMVSGGHLNPSEALVHGTEVMEFMENTWFGDDCYVKLDGKPLLFSWGPLYFKSNSEWETLFSSLDPKPLLFTLDNKKFDTASGAFPWPPMHLSKNGLLSQVDLNLYLTQFYQKSLVWEYRVATAFPGFHDIYEEAGLHDSYGYLDRENGDTFHNTLTLAMNYSPNILQIATWNDFGEGTIIEPTLEFGYQYLEDLQNFRRETIDSTFNFDGDDLLLPLIIYELRKEYAYSYPVHNMLDDAFYHIIEGDIEAAKAIIYSLHPNSIEKDQPQSAEQFTVTEAFPNPFNPRTNFLIDIRSNQPVDILIYDSSGSLIERKPNQKFKIGQNQFQWNGEHLSSGVYFFKFQQGNHLISKKVIHLK